MEKYYLLSVKELCEENGEERLLRAILDRVDKDRREKVEHMRTGAGRAASLGAGLLLQLAVQEALQEGTDGKELGNRVPEAKSNFSEGMGPMDVKKQEAGAEENMAVYTVPQVLKLLKKPLDLKFSYSRKGKPYLRDYPFYFNLSHSGEYVFCAISDREVGVDIQKHGPVDEGRIAGRFFTEEERQVLADCTDSMERRKLFYRMWARKEAYGKLTGEGIAATLGESMLQADVLAQRDAAPSVYWQEWSLPEYAIALCGYKCEKNH